MLLLLAGCGGLATTGPSTSPTATPSVSSVALELFRDPLGRFTLRYSADLSRHVDTTSSDYWGRRTSLAGFSPKLGSALESAGFIVVDAQDAKGKLTAAEASRFWAKRFRGGLRVAKHTRGKVIDPPSRSKNGSATIYSAAVKWGNGATSRFYDVIEGTLQIGFVLRVEHPADQAAMQSRLDDMTSSLKLL
jgi:hypothetical protein